MKKILGLLIVFCCLFPGALQAQDPVYDAELVLLRMENYAKYGDYTISGVFKNKSTVNLTNLVFNWQVDGGEIHRYYKDNFDIRPGQLWLFVHPDQISVNQTKDYEIKVWVTAPNGQEDSNTENDTLYHTLQVIEKYPDKFFLIEEITGAWCGYCPRAPIIYKKQVQPHYPNTLLVAVHTGDAMTCTSAREVMNAYVSGVPCGFVNREKNGTVDLAPELWKTSLDKLDPDLTPVDINIYSYYYPETRELKIDVVADFVIDFQGDLRMNCYIIEDGLQGTGSSWAQRNFFNASAQDPYKELEGAGDPLPGYVHNHVVREMLAGSWGEPNIIPAEIKKGDRYVYTKTIEVPDTWLVENMHLIGIVQAYDEDENKRPIINAKPAEIQLATGIEVIAEDPLVSFFPNPVNQESVFHLSDKSQHMAQVEILNSMGQVIVAMELQAGESKAIPHADLATGLYFYTVLVNGVQVESGRLVKN